MFFDLPIDNQICGSQLAYEISDALGLDLGTGPECRLIFHEPNKVFIHDDDVGDLAEQIQSIIDAHMPNDDWEYLAMPIEELRAWALSQDGITSLHETAIQMAQTNQEILDIVQSLEV